MIKDDIMVLSFTDVGHFERMTNELPAGSFLILDDNKMLMKSESFHDLWDVINGQVNSFIVRTKHVLVTE